jgi:heme oxygenase
MKLHTRSQSPKEGQAPEQTKEPYVPTHMDYLKFLVDSQCVYNAMETIVRLPHLQPQLQVFHSTGLERVQPLEEDIKYMMETYQLIRPIIGQAGRVYEAFLMDLVSDSKNQSSSVTIPRFICHYYNYYFAHTAGGRMIGKQMSALLLDKVTLKFYQWEQGDVNVLKTVVKDNIENLAQTFTDEQKLACEEETANAFRYAGAINMYLSGGGNHH